MVLCKSLLISQRIVPRKRHVVARRLTQVIGSVFQFGTNFVFRLVVHACAVRGIEAQRRAQGKVLQELDINEAVDDCFDVVSPLMIVIKIRYNATAIDMINISREAGIPTFNIFLLIFELNLNFLRFIST